MTTPPGNQGTRCLKPERESDLRITSMGHFPVRVWYSSHNRSRSLLGIACQRTPRIAPSRPDSMLRHGGSPGRAAARRSAASTLPSARSPGGVVIPASRKRAATSAPMFDKSSRESVPGFDAINLTPRQSIPAPHWVGRTGPGWSRQGRAADPRVSLSGDSEHTARRAIACRCAGRRRLVRERGPRWMVRGTSSWCFARGRGRVVSFRPHECAWRRFA